MGLNIPLADYLEKQKNEWFERRFSLWESKKRDIEQGKTLLYGILHESLVLFRGMVVMPGIMDDWWERVSSFAEGVKDASIQFGSVIWDIGTGITPPLLGITSGITSAKFWIDAAKGVRKKVQEHFDREKFLDELIEGRASLQPHRHSLDAILNWDKTVFAKAYEKRSISKGLREWLLSEGVGKGDANYAVSFILREMGRLRHINREAIDFVLNDELRKAIESNRRAIKKNRREIEKRLQDIQYELSEIEFLLRNSLFKRVSGRVRTFRQKVPGTDVEPIVMRPGGPMMIDFRDGFVVWRPEMDEISELLEFDNKDAWFRHAMVTGLSGSGKTTAALHLGYNVHVSGWDVFYAEAADLEGHDQTVLDIFRNREKPTFLIIDNANVNPETIGHIIKGFEQSDTPPDEDWGVLRVLLVARVTGPMDDQLQEKLRSLAKREKTIPLLVTNPFVESLLIEVREQEHKSVPLTADKIVTRIGHDIPILAEAIAQLRKTGSISWDELADFAIKRRLEGLVEDDWETGEALLLVISVFTQTDCMTTSRFLGDILSKVDPALPNVVEVLRTLRKRGHIMSEEWSRKITVSLTHQLLAKLILETKREDTVELLKKQFDECDKVKDDSDGFFNCIEAGLFKRYIEMIPPDFPRYLLRLTVHLIETGRNYDLPVELWGAIKELELRDSRVAMGLTNLGVLLVKNGHLEEAEKAYRTAIEHGPELAEAWYNLGLLLVRNGHLEEAEKAYRTAIGHGPELAKAWYNLGLLLNDSGHLEEAEQAFRTAIEHGPELAKAWYNLGVLLVKNGRLEEAEKAFRTAIEHGPELAEAWYNLGVRLDDSGRLEEAEQAFRTAIEHGPELAEAWYNLGVRLDDSGRLEEAEQAYRTAIEHGPELAEAWSNLGLLLVRNGHLEEAEKAFRTAIEHGPELAEAWYNLACLHAKSEKKDEMIEALRQAIILDKKFCQIAKTDKDFDSVRTHSSFQRLVEDSNQ